jgi:hypothetical protein
MMTPPLLPSFTWSAAACSYQTYFKENRLQLYVIPISSHRTFHHIKNSRYGFEDDDDDDKSCSVITVLIFYSPFVVLKSS